MPQQLLPMSTDRAIRDRVIPITFPLLQAIFEIAQPVRGFEDGTNTLVAPHTLYEIRDGQSLALW